MVQRGRVFQFRLGRVFQFFRLGSLVASRKLGSDCTLVQREDRMQATPPTRQKLRVRFQLDPTFQSLPVFHTCRFCCSDVYSFMSVCLDVAVSF